MKKRIYRNFIGLLLPLIAVMSLSLCLLFYHAFRSREMASVQDAADLVADFINLNAAPTWHDYASHNGDSLRMTVIAPNGRVLLDNKAIADSLENHGNRIEVIDALQTGTGETTRFSHTIATETYYYAVKLKDGNVLRVSKTMGSIIGVFTASLPIVLLLTASILLLANFLAHRLTNSIIRPLNPIDLDNDSPAPYDELLPYLKRIERQKKEIAEQITALKKRTDTTEAITNSMKEGLILIDQTGLVLSANQSAQYIFDLQNLSQKNILHICRDSAFQQGVNQCLSGVNTGITVERNGRIYNVFFSAVYHDEKISGGVVLFLDSTERFETEKQRREFSANVSHELKTPLTAISALAELIASGMAKETDVKAFADKISWHAKRLIHVITDIIRLSEFDEHTIDQENRPFDLYALAESVIEALQEAAQEKNIAVHIVGEPLDMVANRAMIEELLYNLIDNAIKYNHERGSVVITLAKENGFYKISAADTGIGIPPEHQSRVFERFYRVDPSRSKKTGGTGLGLSIIKHIVQHHGGTVALESIEGVGTTVTCYMEGN